MEWSCGRVVLMKTVACDSVSALYFITQSQPIVRLYLRTVWHTNVKLRNNGGIQLSIYMYAIMPIVRGNH